MFVSFIHSHVQWQTKYPPIIAVLLWKMPKCYSKRAISQYVHPYFVSFISLFHTPTLFFTKYSHTTDTYTSHIHDYLYIFTTIRTYVTHMDCWIICLSILVYFICHIPDHPYFLHLVFWFIICLLLFNSHRSCFLCSWGVLLWFIFFLWYFNLYLGITMFSFI